MIGKSQLQLGAEQMISGMSSSDFATDGALGVESFGLNPFVVPGAIYSMAAPTDISSNVVDNIIASCEDAAIGGLPTNNRYMLGDAANFYSYNGSAITKQATGSKIYQAGKSDLMSFDTQYFATSTTNLTRWNGSSTLNESVITFADSNAAHYMLVYQGFLWIADGNSLTTIATNGSGTATPTTQVLTLTSKETIVALGIDPATGLMMISVQTVHDVSDVTASTKAVYLYDGISAKPTRKILVDDLITAFYNVEGYVYVGSGPTLGVWNGNGVTFLRILKNVSLINTDLPYKHHFSNINRVLHVIDGPNVLSYGSVVSGKKGFFYTAFPQNGSTSHLTCLFPAGNSGGPGERLAITYANAGPTYKVYTFDYGSTASGTGTLYFNNIYFPRPVTIRSIRVITTGVTTTAGIGGFTFFDQDNFAPTTQNFISPSQLAPSLGATQYMFEFDYQGYKLQAIQPRLSWSGQGFGVIRFIIYYDVAE